MSEPKLNAVAVRGEIAHGAKRLVPFWSDPEACYVWRLETYVVNGRTADGSWNAMVPGPLASGGRSWAGDIATHYGIDVPEPEGAGPVRA